MGGASRGRRPGEAPAIAVEHGQRPQVDAVGGEPGVERGCERLQVGAAVVVHDALGPAGRAAGVADGQQPALVLAGDGGRAGRGQECLVFIRRAAGDDGPGPGRRRDVGGHVGQLGGGDKDLGAAVAEDVRQLIARQPDVERNEHRPGQRHAVVQLQHDVAVHAQRGDPAARRHAEPQQGAREAVRAVRELGVGEAPFPVDDRGPVPEDPRRPVQVRGGGEWREREPGHLTPPPPGPRPAGIPPPAPSITPHRAGPQTAGRWAARPAWRRHRRAALDSPVNGRPEGRCMTMHPYISAARTAVSGSAR